MFFKTEYMRIMVDNCSFPEKGEYLITGLFDIYYLLKSIYLFPIFR